MPIQELRQRTKAQHGAAVAWSISTTSRPSMFAAGGTNARISSLVIAATGALPLRSHASTASQFGTHEIHATNMYATGNVTPPQISSSGSSMRRVAAPNVRA